MTEKVLYVATGNAGKLRDFEIAARASGEWEIAPLPGLREIAAPDEDGATFEENARAKALYYAARAPEGAIVIADDSGLEVDELGLRPGVYSARFAEHAGFGGAEEMTQDERNNSCLVHMLSNGASRTARYRCVLAAACGDEILATADGVLEGEILLEARGDGGFGYDPLFLLPDLGITMAEVDPATRLELSHRGRALRALLPLLDTCDETSLLRA